MDTTGEVTDIPPVGDPPAVLMGGGGGGARWAGKTLVEFLCAQSSLSKLLLVDDARDLDLDVAKGPTPDEDLPSFSGDFPDMSQSPP